MTCFFCRGNAEQTTTEYIEKILDSVKTFSSTLTVTVIDYIDTAA